MTLQIETNGVVRTLRLDRPKRRNALDEPTLRALVAALEAAEGDDETRAVILTGTDPAFCAGLDLNTFATDPQALLDRHLDAWTSLRSMRTPVIAAVNGAAVTGGLELALNCHVLLASERAVFADTHTRVGIHPGGGITVLLAEAVGLRRARELSLTGRVLDAETAERWGLANRVAPHDQLMAVAGEMAAGICQGDPVTTYALNGTYGELHGVSRTAFDRERALFRHWPVDPTAVEARRAALRGGS